MSLKNNYLKYVKKLGGHQYVINKNIKKSTIDSLMQGCDIGVSKAYEIAQALGITIEELYTGEIKTLQPGEPQAERIGEHPEPYTLPGVPYSPEESHYIRLLIEIMRGKNRKNSSAIQENLEAFHDTRNVQKESLSDCEPGNKKKSQSS